MLHLVDSKAGDCINSVAHYANLSQLHTTMEIEPHCAHQPEYTLPCPLEVYQQPLKYGHLHITDRAAGPMVSAAPLCSLRVTFCQVSSYCIVPGKRPWVLTAQAQKLRVGDCAEGLK